MLRVLQAETAAIEAQTDEIDDDTDVADALEDLNATVLPENFWSVTATLIVEDTDDLANVRRLLAGGGAAFTAARIVAVAIAEGVR